VGSTKVNSTHESRDGPWPHPTRAYFWPAVNKRPTRLRPGYFPSQRTQPEAIFFWPDGKKLKNLTFLIQTQTINVWPDPSHKNLTRPNPGQKFLTRTHHYMKVINCYEKVKKFKSEQCKSIKVEVNGNVNWTYLFISICLKKCTSLAFFAKLGIFFGQFVKTRFSVAIFLCI